MEIISSVMKKNINSVKISLFLTHIFEKYRIFAA